MTDEEREAIMQRAREREIERFTNMTLTDLNLYIIRKRCSNCYNWMKSSMCPREVNVNGRRRGPSMNDFTCSSFVPDFDYAIALEVQTMRKLES
jgi:hypothetical protein